MLQATQEGMCKACSKQIKCPVSQPVLPLLAEISRIDSLSLCLLQTL